MEAEPTLHKVLVPTVAHAHGTRRNRGGIVGVLGGRCNGSPTLEILIQKKEEWEENAFSCALAIPRVRTLVCYVRDQSTSEVCRMPIHHHDCR